MQKQTKILVMNGPNLNMLGTREPGIYGHLTLADIEAKCRSAAEASNLAIDFMQANAEGTLIDTIHDACNKFDWIIINAAGLTHTSVALRDALALFPGGVIEVHISNTHAREEFRHKSLITAISKGVVAGFGVSSYTMAISAVADITNAGA